MRGNPIPDNWGAVRVFFKILEVSLGKASDITERQRVVMEPNLVPLSPDGLSGYNK